MSSMVKYYMSRGMTKKEAKAACRQTGIPKRNRKWRHREAPNDLLSYWRSKGVKVSSNI